MKKIDDLLRRPKRKLESNQDSVVKEQGAEVKEARSDFKKLSTLSMKCHRSVQANILTGETLGTAMLELSTKPAAENADLTNAFQRAGDFELFNGKMIQQLNNDILDDFTIPMQNFVEGDIAEALLAKKRYQRCLQQLDNINVKLKEAQSKKGITPAKLQEVQEEHDRHERETSRLEEYLSAQQAQVCFKKQILTIECLTKYIDAHRVYFDSMAAHLNNMVSELEAAKSHVATLKTEFREAFPHASVEVVGPTRQANKEASMLQNVLKEKDSSSSGIGLNLKALSAAPSAASIFHSPRDSSREHTPTLNNTRHSSFSASFVATPDRIDMLNSEGDGSMMDSGDDSPREAMLSEVRRNLLKKTLEDEHKYVKNLDAILLIKKTLAKDEKLSTKLNEEDLSTIFSNIEELHAFHRNDLVLALEMLNNEWGAPGQSIGAVFRDNADKFEVYIKYMKGFEASSQCLAKCRKASKTFDSCLRIAEGQADPLERLLKCILPRVAQYQGLLENTLSTTRPQDSEYSILREASIRLRDIALRCSQSETSSENTKKLMELNQKITGMDENIVQAHRRLIMEGSMTLTIESSGGGDGKRERSRREEFYFFLFSDTMIYTKKMQRSLNINVKGKVKQYRFAGKLLLDRAYLEDEYGKNSFKMTIGNRMYRFSCSTLDEKEQWSGNLSFVISQLQKPRLFGVPLEDLLFDGETVTTRARSNSSSVGSAPTISADNTTFIPDILRLTTQRISADSLEVEGVLLDAGDPLQVESTRAALDRGMDVDFNELNCFVTSSILKLWLRELPEPLTTWEFSDAFGFVSDVETLTSTINKLPLLYRFSLHHLIKFLGQVIEKSDANGMSREHLAVIFSSSLFRKEHGNCFELSHLSMGNRLTLLLLDNSEAIFAETEAELQKAESDPATFRMLHQSAKTKPHKTPTRSSANSPATSRKDGGVMDGSPPGKTAISPSRPMTDGQVTRPMTPAQSFASRDSSLQAHVPVSPNAASPTAELPSTPSSTTSPALAADSGWQSGPLPSVDQPKKRAVALGSPRASRRGASAANAAVGYSPQVSSPLSPPSRDAETRRSPKRQSTAPDLASPPRSDSLSGVMRQQVPKSPSSPLQMQAARAPTVDKSALVCAKCRTPILNKTARQALDRFWHEECFVCAECGKPFVDGHWYAGSDGFPYCAEDLQRLFPPETCSACNRPIMGPFMKAMGKSWHPDHFVCAECGGSLTQGFFESHGKPYCRPCRQKMKASRSKS